MAKFKILRSLISLIFFVGFLSGAAAQGQNNHFNEAHRLANEGYLETAFQLIRTDVEKELNCTAIGYYWLWSLQFGTLLNDSTFIFSEKQENTTLSKSFSYTFTKNLMMAGLSKTCKYSGVYNKAQGVYWWQKALKSATFEEEANYTDKAVNYFKAALQSGAYDTLTTFYMAEGLLKQYKYGEAIKYYRKTYELDDSQLFSLIKLAATAGKLEEWDTCSKYATKVLQITNDVFEKAACYRLLGESQFAKGKPKTACKWYKKSLALLPNDFDNNLSYVQFLYAHKRNKGIKEAIGFLQLHPMDKNLHAVFDAFLKPLDKETIYNKVLKGLTPNTETYQYVKSNL